MKTRTRMWIDMTREQIWFVVPLADRWSAAYRLAADEGRPVVAELRVLFGDVALIDGAPRGQDPQGDGLTATLLKDEVVMGHHIYELFTDALHELRENPDEPYVEVVAIGESATFEQIPDRYRADAFSRFVGALGFDANQEPRRGRRGPKPWPDAQYATLAREYLEYCKAGSRKPVVEVAAGRDMTEAAVRGALHRARKRRILTEQTAGRAGGHLTPYGESLLEQPANERPRPKRTKKGDSR